MKRPKQINIMGIPYQVSYVDNPAEVDIYKRESLWGQIDYWTKTIRIYDHGRGEVDIWDSIIHEVLHGIAEKLHLNALNDKDNHDQLDRLALALADTLFRNRWFKTEDTVKEK